MTFNSKPENSIKQISLSQFTSLLVKLKKETKNNSASQKPYLVLPKIYEITVSNQDIVTLDYSEFTLFEPVFDSRLANTDTTFIAIQGTNSDGHNYISQAINQGCKVIVCEHLPADLLVEPDKNILFIFVDNSRKFLSFFSNVLYDFPSEKINLIAVTGTNGKTTCTYILKHFYSDILNESVGIIGTTGIFFGEKKIETNHTTPESIHLCQILDKMINSGVKTVIMETSSHALDQSRVANFRFSGAIFTNLTLDHLDYHRTMSAYTKAKKILFDSLPQSSVAVVNADDEHSTTMLQNCQAAKQVLVHFSTTNINSNTQPHYQTHYQIQNQTISLTNIQFELCKKNTNLSKVITSNLIGSFNIQNLTLCLTLFLELNSNSSNSDEFENLLNRLTKCALNINPAKGRMQVFKLINQGTVLIDYAHTPDSLEKAIRSLLEIKQSNPEINITVIFGCGGDRDKSKRAIMGKIASELADNVVITDDNPRTENNIDITNQILQGVSADNIKKVHIINDRKTAIKNTLEPAKKTDLILIAGKGHEDYQIIGTNKSHLSDEEEVRFFM